MTLCISLYVSYNIRYHILALSFSRGCLRPEIHLSCVKITLSLHADEMSSKSPLYVVPVLNAYRASYWSIASSTKMWREWPPHVVELHEHDQTGMAKRLTQGISRYEFDVAGKTMRFICKGSVMLIGWPLPTVVSLPDWGAASTGFIIGQGNGNHRLQQNLGWFHTRQGVRHSFQGIESSSVETRLKWFQGS